MVRVRFDILAAFGVCSKSPASINQVSTILDFNFNQGYDDCLHPAYNQKNHIDKYIKPRVIFGAFDRKISPRSYLLDFTLRYVDIDFDRIVGDDMML